MRTDEDFLAFLLLAVERQQAGGESIERADFGEYDAATVNAHLDELAARGLVGIAKVFGRKYRSTALTAEGRAWLDDHRDELEPVDGGG